jgi:glycosyltransferase involved in cell wall biosynthesis
VQYFEAGSAESLADALVALYEDPERRRSLVRTARERCQTYGWTAQKENYLSGYAALLGRQRDDLGAALTR